MQTIASSRSTGGTLDSIPAERNLLGLANKHLVLAGSVSKSHTACVAGIVARSRIPKSLGGAS
jgi:hypothetical protein